MSSTKYLVLRNLLFINKCLNRLWSKQPMDTHCNVANTLRISRVCRTWAVCSWKALRSRGRYLESVSIPLSFISSWKLKTQTSTCTLSEKLLLCLLRGVVFYAMVVGKLPFPVNQPHGPTLSNNKNASAEHRKQLIKDMKQGLCAKHMYAMLKCSSGKYINRLIGK